MRIATEKTSVILCVLCGFARVFLSVERAQDRPEDRMCDEQCNWSGNAIVHAHESWWLEHAGSRGTVRLARHARMDSRQYLPADHADHQGVREPDNRAVIPGWSPQKVHRQDVKKGKREAKADMQRNPESARTIPIWTEGRPEDQRQIEPRESNRLCDALYRHQSHTGDKSPKQPVLPMDLEIQAACPVRELALRSAKVSAVLINPTCVKPCGKLPST